MEQAFLRLGTKDANLPGPWMGSGPRPTLRVIHESTALDMVGVNAGGRHYPVLPGEQLIELAHRVGAAEPGAELVVCYRERDAA